MLVIKEHCFLQFVVSVARVLNCHVGAKMGRIGMQGGSDNRSGNKADGRKRFVPRTAMLICVGEFFCALRQRR